MQCLDWHSIDLLVKDWCCFVRYSVPETTMVQTAAVHGAAANWISEKVSPEWLCSEPVAGQELPATYRQSVECLALLDFADMAIPADVAPLDSNGCLVCGPSGLVGEGFAPSFFVDVNQAKGTSDWSETVESFAQLHPRSLCILSLRSISIKCKAPSKPVKAAAYRGHKQCATMLQDPITLFFGLWTSALPCLLAIPDVDPAITAVLKPVPTVPCEARGNLIVAHSGPKDRIPKKLFHHFAN